MKLYVISKTVISKPFICLTVISRTVICLTVISQPVISWLLFCRLLSA